MSAVKVAAIPLQEMSKPSNISNETVLDQIHRSKFKLAAHTLQAFISVDQIVTMQDCLVTKYI